MATNDADARAVALRALEHRDRSSAELRERLGQRGISPKECDDAIEALAHAGLVDDTRFAEARATTLAARGYGDAAIDDDLERRGIAQPLRSAAISRLEAELERARRLVECRGRNARTTRYLAARGFTGDSVQAALGAPFAPDP